MNKARIPVGLNVVVQQYFRFLRSDFLRLARFGHELSSVR